MLTHWLAALTAATTAGGCPAGLFQSPDTQERVVILARSDGTSRYAYIDGRRGKVGDAASPLSCADGRLVRAVDQAAWTPVAVKSTDTDFESHGAKLGATLLEPTNPGPHPLVVFVHGSERTSPLAATGSARRNASS